jgi:Xaa-Pro aminopeptidase
VNLVWLFLLAFLASFVSAETNLTSERRHRAANALHDGILILHASSRFDSTADGFRQDPFFYYFTGLENTMAAVLAIDNKSGESGLFLPPDPPFAKRGLVPEVVPGVDAAKRLGVDHVLDWSTLESYLSQRATPGAIIYYTDDGSTLNELPPKLLTGKSTKAPLWIQAILEKWPAFEAKDATGQVQALMEVQDEREIAALRTSARATVAAFMAGLHAVQPDASQRTVEAAVESSCWNDGGRGTSFWPWAMSGENAVFPRPFFSVARYDHLNREMLPGELVRLDVGCEWEHYQGDLGRTIPVSRHFRDDQREAWNIFVAAYQAGVKVLRAGVTVDQVFEAWRTELLKHQSEAKSVLAKHAIPFWAERKNVPFWQVHTSNLAPALPSGPLKPGTTINFEPIASVDGQGFFLEDMYLITNDGFELLTPGVPYSADEIESAMR